MSIKATDLQQVAMLMHLFLYSLLYTASATPYPISQAVSLASAQFHAPVSETKFPATTGETASAEDQVMRHGKADP